MCKAFQELKADWKAEGLSEGREAGMREGEERGRLEGEERIKRLNLKLISEKKFAELEEASRNREFCERLIEMYGI